MMRIAIDARYIHDHFPGIGRYTFNLIRSLAATGDDPLTVFHNPALKNSHYDIASLEAAGNVTLVKLDLPTFSIMEQWRLSKAALNARADLLHSPHYIKPYLPALPSITTIYDAIGARYPEYLPSPLARLIFSLTMRLAVTTSRRVLTLSQSSREDLRRFYGLSSEKAVITYLAADPRYFVRNRSECLAIRDLYDLPDRFALYVGINKPHKNLPMLIQAVNVARRYGDVRLVIAGADDPRWPQVRETVVRLGLTEAVTFVPNIPEAHLPLLYGLAHCFVFPSLYEGFGLPPLEAMASGVPVISSNSSSLPEVVGDAAILLAPLDVSAWAGALAEVWNNQPLSDDLARRGLARAAEFTWDRTALETRKVYREALAS